MFACFLYEHSSYTVFVFVFVSVFHTTTHHILCFCLCLFFAVSAGETVYATRPMLLEGDISLWNKSYARVPLAIIYLFTLIQLVLVIGIWLLIYFGSKVVWGGILFPLPIVALLGIRAFALPLVFSHEHLEALDPSAPASVDDARNNQHQQEQQEQPSQQPPQAQPSGCDIEGHQEAPQGSGQIQLPQGSTPINPRRRKEQTCVL